MSSSRRDPGPQEEPILRNFLPVGVGGEGTLCQAFGFATISQTSLPLMIRQVWWGPVCFNALFLIVPDVTHWGNSSLGFCLCVFREGNDNDQTELGTTDAGRPGPCVSSRTPTPGGHEKTRRRAGAQLKDSPKSTFYHLL